MHPDGRHITSRSYDGTIWIWDTENGAAIGKPSKGYTTVWSISYSPDGGTSSSDLVVGQPMSWAHFHVFPPLVIQRMLIFVPSQTQIVGFEIQGHPQTAVQACIHLLS